MRFFCMALNAEREDFCHAYGIRVIGPGGVTLTEVQEPNLIWPVASGLTYFRIEAFAGIKRAWSQPFFAV